MTVSPSDSLPSMITRMLEAADTDEARFPPTELFNEGWMLRLALYAAAGGADCLPFPFLPGARWFSEARLYSAFLPRFRRDPLAESWTHSDGVVGHFGFSADSKAGLTLDADARQLVVVEAKMFSGLSQGTKNAPGYDQAARTAACIAETLHRAPRPASEVESLGLYVVAPAEQIGSGVFAAELERTSIEAKVSRRVDSYRADPKRSAELQQWLADWLKPTLDRMEVSAVTWEEILSNAEGADPSTGETMRRFYERCLKYNAPRPARHHRR